MFSRIDRYSSNTVRVGPTLITRPCSINIAFVHMLEIKASECEERTIIGIRDVKFFSLLLAFSKKAASPAPIPSSRSSMSGATEVETAKANRILILAE